MKHPSSESEFSDNDTDGDGKVSEQEFAGHQGEHLKRTDLT